jgi:hypothetical protein
MKKLFVAVFVMTLLALNWAALHDIIKGEPNTWMEWSFVTGSVLLALTFTMRRFRQPV